MTLVVRKPVIEGLMQDLPDGPRLIGARCNSCEHTYFPRVPSCRNPDCEGGQLEEAVLPDRGVLYSYTVQHYRPPPLFRVDDWKPYAIGLVEMAGGIRIMGILRGIEHAQLRIGQAVRLVSDMLFVDDDGAEVVTYMFAPADQAEVDL